MLIYFIYFIKQYFKFKKSKINPKVSSDIFMIFAKNVKMDYDTRDAVKLLIDHHDDRLELDDKMLKRFLSKFDLDYLDIYFLHWPDRNTPISESLGQMELLKREGKIRFIGLSNFNKTQIEYALKISKIDCVQAQFSLLKQDVKNMFEFLESNDICFMAYGVLGGGILSGKYKKVSQLAKTDVKNFFYRFYKQDVFETNNQKIQKMCSLIQKPCSQIALNWVRAYKEVSCTLFGARSIEQLNQNIDALSWNLTEKEREVLTNIYEGTC